MIFNEFSRSAVTPSYVYAPAKTIAKLKSTAAGRKKLAAANAKKKEATKKGKQHAKHGLHKGKKR